jgi:hypothetical protein
MICDAKTVAKNSPQMEPQQPILSIFAKRAPKAQPTAVHQLSMSIFRDSFTITADIRCPAAYWERKGAMQRLAKYREVAPVKAHSADALPGHPVAMLSGPAGQNLGRRRRSASLWRRRSTETNPPNSFRSALRVRILDGSISGDWQKFFFSFSFLKSVRLPGNAMTLQKCSFYCCCLPNNHLQSVRKKTFVRCS